MSWSFDLNLRDQDAGYPELQRFPSPPGMKEIASFEKRILQEQSINPSSPSSTTMNTKSKTLQTQILARKKAKAMNMALAPGKQIFMNGFMMYMSGKNLNMFSISITGMAIMNPLKGILNMENAFAPLEGDDDMKDKKSEHLQMPKLLYVVLNLIWLGLGMYKMGSMRLLPTTSADWSGSVVWKELMEISSVPPS